MRFAYYNPNPRGKNIGDCTIRAIAKATGKSWEDTYMSLAAQGYIDGDMPSSNAVWGAYLHKLGYTRHITPNFCPVCYTVEDFARDHPQGTYILALSGHVVCLRDGVLYDTWQSQHETVLYYWSRERND